MPRGTGSCTPSLRLDGSGWLLVRHGGRPPVSRMQLGGALGTMEILNPMTVQIRSRSSSRAPFFDRSRRDQIQRRDYRPRPGRACCAAATGSASAPACASASTEKTPTGDTGTSRRAQVMSCPGHGAAAPRLRARSLSSPTSRRAPACARGRLARLPAGAVFVRRCARPSDLGAWPPPGVMCLRSLRASAGDERVCWQPRARPNDSRTPERTCLRAA
jgi:hypothetical protein